MLSVLALLIFMPHAWHMVSTRAIKLMASTGCTAALNLGLGKAHQLAGWVPMAGANQCCTHIDGALASNY